MNKKSKIIIIISVVVVIIAITSFLLINNSKNKNYFSDLSLNNDYKYSNIYNKNDISYSVYTLNNDEAVKEIINDKSLIKITDDNFDKISNIVAQLKTYIESDQTLYNKISESFSFEETVKSDDYYKLNGSIDGNKFVFTYYNSYSEALFILEKK